MENCVSEMHCREHKDKFRMLHAKVLETTIKQSEILIYLN